MKPWILIAKDIHKRRPIEVINDLKIEWEIFKVYRWDDLDVYMIREY